MKIIFQALYFSVLFKILPFLSDFVKLTQIAFFTSMFMVIFYYLYRRLYFLYLPFVFFNDAIGGT